MAKGSLYIISAPSGAGKTTLVQALLTKLDDVVVSVSHTTRAMRTGEVEGVDYYFVSQDTFESMVKQSEFLEHAEVFGNHYGTSRQHIQEQLELGKDVILEIDWQGARQIRELMAGCRSIYVLPPCISALRERLNSRAQDDATVIERRMQEAVREMSHYNEFDYIVINDDFERAREELAAIFISNRTLKEYQQEKNADLLAALLMNKQVE